jgi:hypothetical protein
MSNGADVEAPKRYGNDAWVWLKKSGLVNLAGNTYHEIKPLF